MERRWCQFYGNATNNKSLLQISGVQYRIDFEWFRTCPKKYRSTSWSNLTNYGKRLINATELSTVSRENKFRSFVGERQGDSDNCTAQKFADFTGLSMTHHLNAHLALERLLGLTAFAAGAVDIISFAGLGGVFASAMTGNLAFLGLYLARFSFLSALGSGIALAGFVAGAAVGTIVSRERSQHKALAILLEVETLLLATSAMIWLMTPHHNGSTSTYCLILMLAVSMGLQSIVGKRINLANIPTVVFTSTLTNIVIALTDVITTRTYALPKDTKRQFTSFLLYFLGALCAGFCAFFELKILILLPLMAMGVAVVIALAHSELGSS